MKCCLLGLHDWRYFKRDGRKYPDHVRICSRCGKTQVLLYDFLTFNWQDGGATIPWKELAEVRKP